MPTRLRRFYLLALWTPLVIPCLVAAGFALQGGGNYTGRLAGIGFILLLSLYSTGIPYALCALWITRWLMAPARAEREIRRLMWRAPLIVALLAIPAWTIMLGTQDGPLVGFVEGIVFCGPFLLVLGYLYVVATATVRALLRVTGFFAMQAS